MASDNTAANYSGTAGTTAIKLAGPRPNFAGGIIIQNLSSTIDIFIGDGNVTAANGFKIAAGTAVPIPSIGEIWMITSTSTADTRGLALQG